MTVLPIVGRELAVASRRSATYWLRFWVAAGAVAIFFVPFLNSRNSITEMGQALFIVLGSGMLGFSMLAGVFLTADCLSAEKREGTLGLLFLTDLKGYDVVLGKMAANSLQAFFGLLAVFPVLGLPLLTGGLSGGEFWRTILVLTVTMYFSLSVGMLVSAASRKGRQAMGGTLAAILLLSGVILPQLWQLLLRMNHLVRLDFLLWPSPVYAYMKGFDSSYSTPYGRRFFWHAMTTIFALASACILAASILLPRSWQKSAAADPNLERPRFQFLSGARGWRRPRLENMNPFFWLALGDRSGQSAMNLILILLGVLWAAMVVFLWDSRNLQFIFFPAFALHFTVKILIATESGRRFYQDRQSGALELLLATPLPARAIVAGQRAALWKRFKPALWLISVANVVTFAVVFERVVLEASGTIPASEYISMVEVFFGGVVMLWLDAGALISLGMWKGLKAGKYPRSVFATWGQVVLPPWLAIVLFALIAPRISDDALIFLFAFWCGIGMAIDLAAIARADGKLTTTLRSVVSEGCEG